MDGMSDLPLEAAIEAVAALDDPVRRKLYLYVAGRSKAVSRDEAARAGGISRPLAAYHLDTLVEQGLLAADFLRLSGRRGPGAGRPSKLYRRSDRQFDVSLPPRDYELAGRLLAQALAGTSPEAETALHASARRFGAELGLRARRRAGRRPSSERLLAEAEDVLRARGFEPSRDRKGEIRLLNCPFHRLSREHPDLICRMNLTLMEGLIGALGVAGVRLELDRQPGRCCVVLKHRRRGSQ